MTQSQTLSVFARLPLLDLLVSPTQLSLTCESYAGMAWHNMEELIAKINKMNGGTLYLYSTVLYWTWYSLKLRCMKNFEIRSQSIPMGVPYQMRGQIVEGFQFVRDNCRDCLPLCDNGCQWPSAYLLLLWPYAPCKACTANSVFVWLWKGRIVSEYDIWIFQVHVWSFRIVKGTLKAITDQLALKTIRDERLGWAKNP